MRQESPSSLSRGVVGTILFARTITALNFRIVYPFLPAIARGLGISLERAGQLVAVQGGLGLVSPLLGFLSDRYGRRRIMVGALLLLALASTIAYLNDQYLPFLLAFAGIGLAKGLYDPAMQAYVGDTVPYAYRGRIIAITELGWSFAWLLGVPGAGFLIARAGWKTPWAVIAVLSLLGAVATHLILPPARREHLDGHRSRVVPLWELLQRGPVAASIVASFGIFFAVENIFIVYGAYLENRFGLAVAAIGVVSVIVGIAELLAETGAAAWTDRIGKKRSVMLGVALFAVSLLLLATGGGALWSALGSYALAILFFEFTIVSFIPLITELAPDARATVAALGVAAAGLARIIAPLLGAAIYNRTGSILVNALLSLLACLFGILVLWRGVEE